MLDQPTAAVKNPNHNSHDCGYSPRNLHCFAAYYLYQTLEPIALWEPIPFCFCYGYCQAQSPGYYHQKSAIRDPQTVPNHHGRNHSTLRPERSESEAEIGPDRCSPYSVFQTGPNHRPCCVPDAMACHQHWVESH